MTDALSRVSGPFPIKPEDLPSLNALFSDAFSDRYRRDGMAGVRVPPLNPLIWRFAIDGAGSGALRCAIRMQGEYPSAFRALVARGARVRWTDLRMTLAGFDDAPPARGLVLSNWEI